ncbi:hypothetical protein GF357_04020 [Candidatus Dojkabacteria bacterium]|nr:hypothetical protein [Candidatus Dojkabacteria bacterium]
MAKKRDKNRISLVVALFLFVATAATVSLVILRIRRNFDTRTEAVNSQEPLWTISIIGDTQSKPDTFVFEKAFPLIIQEDEPDMMIHVGDMTFASHKDYPLKGILDVLLWKRRKLGDEAPIVEVHLVPGNHDDSDSGHLYLHYITGVCYGRHKGDYEGTFYVDHYPPLNSVVQSVNNYCTKTAPTSTDLEYAFQRGNIRFLILDMPFYRGEEEIDQREWLKNKVCEKNNAEVTLAFTHEDFFGEGNKNRHVENFLHEVHSICPENNLAAIFMGHGHRFTHVQDSVSGVHMIETQGMWWISGLEHEKKNGFLTLDVHEDKLSIYRRVMASDETEFSPRIHFLDIPGDFIGYDEEPPSSETEEYQIPRGLSLLSFDTSFLGTVSEFIDLQPDGVDSIKSISKFDDGRWIGYQITENGGVGTDFKMNSNLGYLVYSEEQVSINIPISTSQVEPESELDVGWNLLGVPKNLNTASLYKSHLESEKVEILSICEMKPGGNRGYRCYITHDDNIYGEDFDLDPKTGYFVYQSSE